MTRKNSRTDSKTSGFGRVLEPFRWALAPAALLLVLSYFVYHALEGRNGLFALTELKAREAALEPKVAELEARRARLEARVSLLRPTALDLDMLDEAARRKLAFVQERDVVIPLDNRPVKVDQDGN